MAAETITTTCTMDCPDSCTLEITVEDDKISKIGPAREAHPNMEGFICTKVSRFAQRVYHKDRLLYPLRRAGKKGEGTFERISWEEAISEITERFQEISKTWGSEAIMPYHYGGSNGVLGDGFLDFYFFAKLGASRCEKTMCAAPTTAVATGMYGKIPGIAFEDYPQAKFILLWGVNPKASNIHLIPYLRKAKRNGAFIAAVDPNKNFSDKEVDLHLPVFPGADLPLALGMINYWHENDLLDQAFLADHATGLETLLENAKNWPLARAAETAKVNIEDIKLLAERYADTAPALLRCGWGLERNINGGQAVAAVLAMPSLLGKFGVRSGGYTLSNSGAATVNSQQIFGDYEWNTRKINQSQLGDFLNSRDMDPPIKSLFVYNCNVVATAPDQNAIIKGLMRDDVFTVVHEQVMTDTCFYGDILLPAVTFLEQQEIKKAYGSYFVGGVQPAIAPVGESKPNEEVFAMLGRAMGWDDEQFQWNTDDYMKKTIAALSLNGDKAQPALIANGKVQPFGFNGAPPIQFKTVFPRTSDQKVHLTPAVLGDHPYQYQPVQAEKYPLAMISPATNKMVSSTLGEFNYPTLYATINPADAAKRHIKSGDTVRAFNELGEVICLAKVSDSVREGVVSMPKGAWRKSAKNGQAPTALCPQTVNVVAGGACYNDSRIEIESFQSE